MKISEAARRTGVSAKMIRHYEQKGLLSPVARNEASYRQYDESSVEELCFIRQARDLGFSIRKIDDLLKLRRDPKRASKQVREFTQQHLLEIENKMLELMAMKNTLEKLIAACPGNEAPDCAILEQLSQRKKR